MTVYLRDVSSGRIHAGERRGADVLTAEADNLDDAGERVEITLADAMEADADALCARCFPEPETFRAAPNVDVHGDDTEAAG